MGLIGAHSSLGQVIDGQHCIIGTIEETVRTSKRPRIWIHASSFGEYGVVRPIVQRLAELNKYDIILTFFSPTGVNALLNNHPNVHSAHYLPLDTISNARAFIDIISPVKVLFSVSEIWPNYLKVLKDKEIPTYLIAGLITKRHPIFNILYGSFFRLALQGFTSFLVLDKSSQENLAKAGFNNSLLIGDPLFDNVLACASTPYYDAIIDKSKTLSQS